MEEIKKKKKIVLAKKISSLNEAKFSRNSFGDEIFCPYMYPKLLKHSFCDKKLKHSFGDEIFRRQN